MGAGNVLRRTPKAKYAYDKRGRRIGKLCTDGARAGAETEQRAVEYRWDARDRLREVSLADGMRVRFDYDAFGRRVAKTTIERTGHTRSCRFIWDGLVLAGEIDTERGARWFVHRPTTFIPLLQEERGEVFVYVNDHVGTPKELIDKSGRIAWAAAHDAWGNVLEVQGDGASRASRGYVVDSPFRLVGQYADEETGLCHTLHRYFDPEVGRWCSPDPLGISGGDNLYGFDGTPVRFGDPLGLSHQNQDGSESTAGKTKDEVLADAKPIGISKPGMGADKYEKTGGADAANKDFDALTAGQPTRDYPGGAKAATMPDGSNIIVRPSKAGPTTVEIQPADDSNPTKIRYP